jgi:uncharacterized membrane protein YebE (DUF533 family)
MNSTVKMALMAVGGGIGTAVAGGVLKDTDFMKQHPEAWYAEAAAAGLVGWILVKKSPSLAAALFGGAGMLAYQGYQNNEEQKAVAQNNSSLHVAGSLPTTLGGLLGQGATSDDAGAVISRGFNLDNAGAVIQRTRRGF